MKAGMDDIREVDSQEPYVIEKGIVSTQRVGLSFMKILNDYPSDPSDF
jgi:hypothetical protein